MVIDRTPVERQEERQKRCARVLVGVTLLLFGVAATAHAQGRGDCRDPQAATFGIAVGRSSPYLEMDVRAVEGEGSGSLSVRGGPQLGVRAEVPIAGPLRVRFEGAASHWDVTRTRYDPGAGFSVTDVSSIGTMSARHFVALAGGTTGTPPVCAHVMAGGGLYTIGFRGASLRRAGVAIAAGVDIPAFANGVIQIGATLHLINIGDGQPITYSTGAPTLSLLAAWAYRF